MRTRIEFGVEDIHDVNGVLTHFEAFVTVEQNGRVVARGNLGQFVWRQDAERTALEAHERASSIEIDLAL